MYLLSPDGFDKTTSPSASRPGEEDLGTETRTGTRKRSNERPILEGTMLLVVEPGRKPIKTQSRDGTLIRSSFGEFCFPWTETKSKSKWEGDR